MLCVTLQKYLKFLSNRRKIIAILSIMAINSRTKLQFSCIFRDYLITMFLLRCRNYNLEGLSSQGISQLGYSEQCQLLTNELQSSQTGVQKHQSRHHWLTPSTSIEKYFLSELKRTSSLKFIQFSNFIMDQNSSFSLLRSSLSSLLSEVLFQQPEDYQERSPAVLGHDGSRLKFEQNSISKTVWFLLLELFLAFVSSYLLFKLMQFYCCISFSKQVTSFSKEYKESLTSYSKKGLLMILNRFFCKNVSSQYVLQISDVFKYSLSATSLITIALLTVSKQKYSLKTGEFQNLNMMELGLLSSIQLFLM